MSSAVITMRSHPGHSPTPTTTTSGRPTSSAHMRVPSVSKQGLPRLDDVRHRDNRRAPVPRPGPLPADHPTIRSEAPFIGLTPAGLDVSWIGVELDPTTAAICALLYP